MNPTENGPLDGLKVLDLTRMLPGPFCTMVLADWGADVLMVEQPSGPALGPRRKGFHVNRNKRSLVLNLKDPRGMEIFYQLVAGADVVVEGFRPGVPARLHIDYPTLADVNPGLVYCAISGYGQDGPYRSRVGHDINYIALSGLLSLTGNRDGQPMIPGTQVADIGGGGLMAANSILAALFFRERSGRGQYIDLSMTDAALSFNAIALHEYFSTGIPPERGGHRLLGGVACYQVYETRDGRYVSIGALEPKFWSTLCRLLGREDLIGKQYDHSPETVEALGKIFASRTSKEWDALLSEEEVCYAPVLDPKEATENHQVRHREMILPAAGPDHAVQQQVGIVPKFSVTPGRVRMPSPEPGQHTHEVLRQLGMDAHRIAEMEKEGVVKGISPP